MCFEKIEDPSRDSLQPSSRPERFYTVLRSCKNYFLNEVTLVNVFHSKTELQRYAGQIRMKDIAQRMFVDEYKGMSGDVRGNLRYDIGYTAVNQTDASVVKGMFFPKQLKVCSLSKGFEDDLTLEHSLFRYGCYVKMMADEIQKDPGNEGSSTFFAHKKGMNGLVVGGLMHWCFRLFGIGHALMDCLVSEQVKQ